MLKARTFIVKLPWRRCIIFQCIVFVEDLDAEGDGTDKESDKLGKFSSRCQYQNMQILFTSKQETITS